MAFGNNIVIAVLTLILIFQVPASRGCVVKLLVTLSFQHEGEPAASWERGLDILPGAEIAVQNINKISECELQLTRVSSGQCGATKNFNFLQELFMHLQSLSSNESLGVVGLLCNSDEFQLLIRGSPFRDDLKRHRHKLEAANSFPNPVKLSTSLIRALFGFMKHLNWRKLGVITEIRDTYFSRTAKVLYSETKLNPDTNVTVVMYNQIQDNNRENVIPHVSKINFLSASLQITVDVLCSVQQKNLVWPKRVWILHSYLLDDITNLQAPCSIDKALENVLFIREQTRDDVFNDSRNNFNRKYQSLTNNSHPNPFSIVLHNLIWETALELNVTYDAQLSVLEHRPIEITQFRNSTEIPIAVISGNNITFTDFQFTGTALSDELPVQFEGATTAYTIIFSIEIVIGFMLVTFMLVCYIYFRKEPEVKSTSLTLSLLMFLCNYFYLIFMSLLLIFHQPLNLSSTVFNIICVIFPWLSDVGVSGTLLPAIIVVKLARVYHIFNKSTFKPLGKKCSDLFLAVYVLLILSPMIIIYTIWTIFDRFEVSFFPSHQQGFIQKICISDHQGTWLLLAALYITIIYFFMIGIAVRSRKINRKDFKDTKKVNMAVFLTFFQYIITLFLWSFFRDLGTSVPAHIYVIPLHIGHFLAILICQLLLFAPKIFAPLTRCIKKKIIN